MPLNAKGRKILASMKQQYGERGEGVFYASIKSGKIKGVEEGMRSKGRGGRRK